MSNRIEISSIWLLNLNIWISSVVIVLNRLQLLLLQMRCEIVLLLVIKVVDTSNFLVSIFGILFLSIFAVRLRKDERFVYVLWNGTRIKSVLSKMCSTLNDRFNHWHLLWVSNIFHDIQVILKRPWVVAISNLILILE